MKLENQKDKFNLSQDVSYLNCAYMGPTLKASMEAGEAMMQRLSHPYDITSKDFFEPVDALRKAYAKLIHCNDPQRIALVPSVSYGTANVVRQLRPTRRSNVVMAYEEFPSSVHPWRRLCEDFGCELRLVMPPVDPPVRAKAWNAAFLNMIDSHTAAVVTAPLHWSDGSLFVLEAIRDACKQHDAVFVIDGSQWIGAAPFDVEALQPDAVVNAGYKWLFSPYGASYAYYGAFFDEGIPIEENWITHEDSRDFSLLVNSNPKLLPKGLRYSAGQHASQIYVAMQQAAIDQILEWGPAQIQAYDAELYKALESNFDGMADLVEEDDFRAKHLFGIHFGRGADVGALKARLDTEKIYVSQRGDSLRVSLHLWNTVEDVERLALALSQMV